MADEEYKEVEEAQPEAAPDPNAIPDQPVCPYCGADPLMPNIIPYQHPSGVRMVALYCGNLKCRKTITVQLLPASRQVVAAGPASRIHLPS